MFTRKCNNSSLHVVVDLHAAVGSVVFIFTMDMQKWAVFALLLSYKISRSAASSIQVLTSSCEVPDILVRFNRILTEFRVS
jgi:hypothetical protein